MRVKMYFDDGTEATYEAVKLEVDAPVRIESSYTVTLVDFEAHVQAEAKS